MIVCRFEMKHFLSQTYNNNVNLSTNYKQNYFKLVRLFLLRYTIEGNKHFFNYHFKSK